MSPFLIDEIERTYPSPGEDLDSRAADLLDAVADVVERWSEHVSRWGEDEGSQAYYRAEVVLGRLRGMPPGWWELHAEDSVEELLALVPCQAPGCNGLLRPGYAAVALRAYGKHLCDGCGEVEAAGRGWLAEVLT